MKVLREDRGIECNECGKECNTVVQVGDEPPGHFCDDLMTARVCLDCLKKAVKLAKIRGGVSGESPL